MVAQKDNPMVGTSLYPSGYGTSTVWVRVFCRPVRFKSNILEVMGLLLLSTAKSFSLQVYAKWFSVQLVAPGKCTKLNLSLFLFVTFMINVSNICMINVCKLPVLHLDGKLE